MSEKELTRQLQRERDKLRIIKTKLQRAEEDYQQIQMALTQDSAVASNLPYHAKYSTIVSVGQQKVQIYGAAWVFYL